MENQAHTDQAQHPKLLEQVRAKLRLHHYSIHTERTYLAWIKRYVLYHKMNSREDLQPAEPKIEAFLTSLALDKNVAPATQNQAMNALIFLYRRVLEQALDGKIDAIRAERKENVPVVMTRDEVAKVQVLWTIWASETLRNKNLPVSPAS